VCRPSHDCRLSGQLHLRLLAALAADATNCGQLRILLAEREAILASLTVDRQKEVRAWPECPRQSWQTTLRQSGWLQALDGVNAQFLVLLTHPSHVNVARRRSI
jgi:hypothetical protein